MVCASISPASRSFRGLKNLPPGRSKACPVLNMMRNTLPPLLQYFVSPLFQLRGDSLNPGGLFDGSDFDVAGVTIAKLRIRELYHGMCGVFIKPFAEFVEHFNSGADLGSRWCLHNQMWMPREGLWVMLWRCPGRCLGSNCARCSSSDVMGCAHGSLKPSRAAASSAASLVGASITVRSGSPIARAYSRSVW